METTIITHCQSNTLVLLTGSDFCLWYLLSCTSFGSWSWWTWFSFWTFGTCWSWFTTWTRIATRPCWTFRTFMTWMKKAERRRSSVYLLSKRVHVDVLEAHSLHTCWSVFTQYHWKWSTTKSTVKSDICLFKMFLGTVCVGGMLPGIPISPWSPSGPEIPGRPFCPSLPGSPGGPDRHTHSSAVKS